jgi:CheY-like chemotaxis protein
MEPTGNKNLDTTSWFGSGWTRLEGFFSTTLARASASTLAKSLLPAGADDLEPGRLQVLVAEDDPALQLLTCEALAALEVTPRLAANGEQAVALANAHEFDLILMDLQMPVLDGLGATMKIRRHEQERGRARVPVVAYTACAFGGNEPFLLGFGIDAVLEKPCTRQALHDCLLSWVAPRRAAGLLHEPGRGTPARLR